MRSVMRKEMKLSASPLAYFFVGFGLMFLLPGYPVLCGEFFVTLGLYQSFVYAREANDIVFSALLPIAKKDVVKGKFEFSCFIEMCGFALMIVATLLRMTAFADGAVYRANALMNANPFALGMSLLLFGVFNMIFIAGFFRTAYKAGKPFLVYIIACFVIMGVAEALHYIPGFSLLNAFGFDNIGLQLICFIAGALCYVGLTLLAYKKACNDFEKIDL